MTNSHKETATNFLKLVSSGEVEKAYDLYIAEGFRHHNPYYPGDAHALAEGMKESAVNMPNKIFEVMHVIEDSAMVAVHSRLQLEPNGQALTVVHIMNFKDDKIEELWDITQQVPTDTPNENGMF